MACGCSKGGAMSGAAMVPTAAEPAQDGERWEAVFPNGQTAVFDAPWKAHKAVALRGGRVRHITAGPKSA